MTKLEDFFPALPEIDTEDAARDAHLRALEGLPWDGPDRALASSTAFDVLAQDRDALPHLLARLEIVARTGDVAVVEKSDHPLHEDAWNLARSRQQSVFWLARAVAAHHDARAEAKLLDMFLTHAWLEARYAAGAALLHEGAARETYEAMSAVMDWDNPNGTALGIRDMGISAAFRMAPETAFERLSPRLLAEAAKGGHSHFYRAFYEPLIKPGTPLDPRWVAVLVKFFETRESPEYWLEDRRHEKPVVDAVVAYIDAAVARDAPWQSFYGPLQLLLAWELGETAPQALRVLELSAARGKTNFELTIPLEVLTKIGDASVLPALDALAEKVARKAKQAVLATIASLEATLDADALAARRAPKAPAKKTTRSGKSGPSAKKADAAEDPERAALREVLAKTTLADARIREIIALARPRILITAKSDAAAKRARSRFGGAPDLAPGAAWPTVRMPPKAAKKQLRAETLERTPHVIDGSDAVFPMAFVGQIDLAELAELDREARLPRDGLLSFFVRQDIVTSFKGDLPRLASAVLYTRGETTERAPPEGHDPRDVVPPCSVAFARDFPLPPSAIILRLGLMNAEHKALEAIEQPGAGAFASMLGWARADYYRGLPRKGETLLLGVSSDSPPGFTFADDSSIFFSMKDADLASAAFDKSVADADE